MDRFYIPRRFIFVFGTFFISLFMYIDRACISAAKEPITGDLGLTDNQMGWVLSAFALGYALFQVPGGLMSDRFGPRKVLAGIITLWSLFTALTGMVKSYSGMLIVRFLFGGGEAGAFPGISRAVYSWIPMKERGIVQGINFSGSRIGAAVAMPLVAGMITALGWRTSFIILGIAGIVFAFLWYALFRNKPEEIKIISKREREIILSGRQQDEKIKPPPLTAGKLFGSVNMWLAMLQYFGSNFTFFFALTWLLPHLRETYDLELMQAGIYASAPFVAGALGNWISGIIVDAIYRQGRWKLSRKVPAVMGFVLMITGLIGSLYMDTAFSSVAFLSIAIFGADMTLSPSWSFCIDIGKENSGSVSGTMNMAGNIGSFVTALAFPYLLSWTGNVDAFFYVAALLGVFSIFAWLRMDPKKSLT
ncbi:MAG: MFS transporter [Bacteroidales bacterium]|nr:MFS transporter [Bacteroidales bacterium]